MTFSYNGTLPNPPDDPADDVTQMQTNSDSIASIIAVDHVGFNVAQGGEHNQVTFAANNTPAGPPFTPPTLFTYLDAVSSLAQLKYYTGGAANSSSQYVVGSNGSTMLFGGIIIKWFTVTFTGNFQAYDFATDLSIAHFPNNAYGAVCATKTGGQIVGYSNLTASSITITHGNGGVSISSTFFVIGN